MSDFPPTGPQFIDIYHGQNDARIRATGKNIDWQFVKDNNPSISGVVIKAAEGNNYKDPMFDYNRVVAKLFSFTAYYLWIHNPSKGRGTIKQQIDFYSSIVGKLEPNAATMLDIEWPTSGEGPNKDHAHEAASLLHDRFGLWPLSYFGRSYLDFNTFRKYVTCDGKCPWIIPAYGNNNGQMNQSTWSKWVQPIEAVGPDAWQYCSQGRPVNGLTGPIDWDVILNPTKFFSSTANGNVKPLPVYPHKKDTDMAKLLQVKEPDGSVDIAAFSVAGQCATWVSTDDELQVLNQLGLVPDRSQTEFVNRQQLKTLILVSAGPNYPDGYSGPRTANSDFRDTA